MPEITVTEDQYERLTALGERLAEEHAGPYASVRPPDVIAYLLDLEVTTDETPAPASTEAVENAPAEPTEQDEASRLNAMLNLLKTHDDKWRESAGDEPYEVDLPDGSVETARTKDDVKALLFKHY